MARTKLSTAWLFHWCFVNEKLFASYNEPIVAGALDSRMTQRDVERVILTLYGAASDNQPCGRVKRLYHSSRCKRRWIPESNPSGGTTSEPVDWPRWEHLGTQCTYGGFQPWLVAQKAYNVVLDEIDAFHEHIYWQVSRPKHNPQGMPTYTEHRFSVETFMRAGEAVRNIQRFGEDAIPPKKCPPPRGI